jgi:hypothetical protein
MTQASTTPTTQVTTATRMRCSDAARGRVFVLSRLPSRSGTEALSLTKVIPELGTGTAAHSEGHQRVSLEVSA